MVQRAGSEKKNRNTRGQFFYGALLLFMIYTAGGLAVSSLTRQYLPALEDAARQSGLILSGIRFEKARLVFPLGLRWEGISADLSDRKHKGRTLALTLGRLDAEVWALFQGVIKIRGESMSLSLVPAESSGSAPQLKTIKSIQGDFSWRLRTGALTEDGIWASFKREAAGVSDLVRKGAGHLDLDYRGMGYFTVREIRCFAGLSTVREGSQVRLVMEPDSVKRIALQLDEELTDAEVQLISKNPVRAARLFEIKDAVKREIESVSRGERNVPEDAYKHVLWSYLLTREFGEDFAKEVTDSHEQGARTNTQADHLMDYQNNLIGRRYAVQKVPREEVLERMMRDSGVIREAAKSKIPKK